MWYLCSDLCDMPWTMSAKPWTNFQKWSPHCSNWNRTNCKNDKGEVVLSKGLRSRVVRRRRFLGGVRFLTTLGVGVGLFVRPRLWMSNCIIFYIALLNWKFLLEWYNFFWNVCWNRDILLCTTIPTDFNSQIDFNSQTAKFHSIDVEESESGVGKIAKSESDILPPTPQPCLSRHYSVFHAIV